MDIGRLIHADMAAAGFFLWLWLALWLFDKLNIAQFDLGTEQSGLHKEFPLFVWKCADRAD